MLNGTQLFTRSVWFENAWNGHGTTQSGGTREVMGAYKYVEEMWRKKQSEAWSDFSWGNAMSNKGVDVFGRWEMSWQFYIWLLPLDSMPPISSHLP